MGRTGGRDKKERHGGQEGTSLRGSGGGVSAARPRRGRAQSTKYRGLVRCAGMLDMDARFTCIRVVPASRAVRSPSTEPWIGLIRRKGRTEPARPKRKERRRAKTSEDAQWQLLVRRFGFLFESIHLPSPISAHFCSFSFTVLSSFSLAIPQSHLQAVRLQPVGTSGARHPAEPEPPRTGNATLCATCRSMFTEAWRTSSLLRVRFLLSVV